MQSISVLKNGNLDFHQMEKSDVSKNLFGEIHWEEIMRSGVFLQQRHHQLLEKAQSNLGLVIDSPPDARELSSMLIQIAENCTSNLIVQQYAFTRIEEILGLGSDYSDADVEVFGTRNAHLFTSDGLHVIDGPFLRALNNPDSYLQRSASLGLASLFTVREGNLIALVQWINTKLQSPTIGVWDMALPALSVLAGSAPARKVLIDNGAVTGVVSLLNRLGVNGNAQQIYELCFILWSLSLGSENDLNAFLTARAVTTLVDFLAAAPSRKVARMAMAALRNLSLSEDHDILTEMLSSNLEKVLQNIVQTNGPKPSNDVDADADLKAVREVLLRNYRELSSFERWANEVRAGSLRWGVVHTEKFWRENAKFMEQNDFKLLSALIALIKSTDKEIVTIALYDLGDFTRFYPNGRVIVSRLGGKEAAMQLVGDADMELQRHALQCVSKIMVTNWEFMK